MNFKPWLSAIFILFVVVLGLGAVKFGQIQAAIAFAETFPEPSATVKSTFVETSAVTKTTKVIGELQAPQMLPVSNEYAGAITFVGFKPGDNVEQNQVLLRIDDRTEQASLKAAKARLKLATVTHKRFEKLLKQNRISQDEVDKALADVSISQADVDNFNNIINKKVIRAAFAGQVGLEQYQVGQLLGSNTNITTLIGKSDKIWVNFSLAQTLPQLAIGDKVQIIVTSALSSDNNTPSYATIIAKKALIDASSRHQGYRAELDNSQHNFSHNQIVQVLAPISSRNVALVPTNAITRNHFGNFVYQLVEDESGSLRAKAIKVELGEKLKHQQTILSGLNGDELIAGEGAFKLSEGLLVFTQDTNQITALVRGN